MKINKKIIKNVILTAFLGLVILTAFAINTLFNSEQLDFIDKTIENELILVDDGMSISQFKELKQGIFDSIRHLKIKPSFEENDFSSEDEYLKIMTQYALVKKITREPFGTYDIDLTKIKISDKVRNELNTEINKYLKINKKMSKNIEIHTKEGYVSVLNSMRRVLDFKFALSQSGLTYLIDSDYKLININPNWSFEYSGTLLGFIEEFADQTGMSFQIQQNKVTFYGGLVRR